MTKANPMRRDMTLTDSRFVMNKPIDRSQRVYLAKTRIHNFARRAAYLSYGIARGVRAEPQLIVIIGQMRAGSTMLTHILGSNPGMIGFGETHLSYRNALDRRAVAGKVLYVMRDVTPDSLDIAATTFIDKSLHNYQLDLRHIGVVAAPSVRPILLVREPAGSIGSTIAAFGFSFEDALYYWTNRLDMMGRYAVALADRGRPPSLVVYDELVERPDAVLRHLTDGLGLAEPLSARYDTDVLVRTSMKGGDHSVYVTEGEIVPARRDHSDVLGSADLGSVEDEYARTLEILRRACAR
jgi:hypothetical protein